MFGARRNGRQSRLKSPRGQVTPDSMMGMWIYLLASGDSISQILEIGTWRGLGTTLCIHNAVAGTNKKAISLEVNGDLRDEAVRNLGEGSPVSILHGTIVEESDLDDRDLTEQEQKWLLDDIFHIREAPNVMHLLPSTIDLLVLDGGEFSSEAEFLKLEPRVTGYIVLDDILVRKNRRVHAVLSTSKSWKCIASGSDRHGWSVFARIL